MLGKKLSLINSILSIGIVIFAANNVRAASPQSERIWGQDRYKTCSAVVKEGWQSCDYVLTGTPSNNTVNTSGNICNFGYYAVQGNWVYYSNFDDGGRLYKMKIDGTRSQKLCDDNVKFINVVGDWVYYLSYNNDKSYINKIKTDGSSKTTLIEDEGYTRFLNVCGDRIYYIVGKGGGVANSWYYSVNELKTDGTKVGEAFRFPKTCSPMYFNVAGNYGYCLVNQFEGNNPKNYIYKFSLYGSGNFTKLVEGAITFNVSEDWIYYGNFNEIRKIKVDGKEDQKITDGFPGGLPDGQGGDPPCLNVEGNWIYYKDWPTQEVYKVDVNGNSKTKLADCVAGSISIVGDYLYCPEYVPDSSGEFYKYASIRKIKK